MLRPRIPSLLSRECAARGQVVDRATYRSGAAHPLRLCFRPGRLPCTTRIYDPVMRAFRQRDHEATEDIIERPARAKLPAVSMRQESKSVACHDNGED